MTVSPQTIELLAARRDWILALARRLVHDTHLAEDVAQEVAVAALASAPRARQIGTAWLAGIVRHVASNLRRRRARQARREANHALAEHVPAVADSLAFAEGQQRLLAAVLSLDEAFRDVVLLRFFESLPQREIARRLDIPVATVNSRLTRALARLRTRLDADSGGDRRVWMAALLPLAARAPMGGVAVTGTLLMKKNTLVAALAVVLLGAGTLYVSRGDTADAELPRVTEPVMSADVATKPAAEVLPTPIEPPPRTLAAPPSAPPGERIAIVDGITGDPVPAAEVFLIDEAAGSAAQAQAMRESNRDRLDPLEMAFAIGSRQAVSRDASIVRPSSQRCVLFARADERRGALELRGRETADPKLLLWPLRTVRVSVVDALGRAMAKVPVAWQVDAGGRWVPRNVQSTGDDGTADLRWFRTMREHDGLEQAIQVALGFPGGEGITASIDDTLEHAHIRLECPPVGKVVIATVGGGATGHAGLMPREGAMIPMDAALVEHRAEFWPVGVGAPLTAMVWTNDRAHQAEGHGPDVADGVSTITIDLGGATNVRGRLLHRGQPLRNASMICRVLDGDVEDDVTFQTDADGRFECALVLGASARALELRHGSGTSTAKVEVKLSIVRPAEGLDLGELELVAEALRLEGSVVFSDDSPVRDAWIDVQTRSTDDPPRFTTLLTARVGNDGRFSIPREADSDLWLTARGGGDWFHEPQRCSSDGAEHRLVVASAGSLTAQILFHESVDPRRLEVALWDERGGAAPLDDATAWITTSVDAKGRVRHGGLRPSRYTVAVFRSFRWSAPAIAVRHAVEVRADAASSDPPIDLDVRAAVRGLRIQVRGDDRRMLDADVFAILGEGRARSLEWLGKTSSPLIVLTANPPTGLIVEADGWFAAAADPMLPSQEITLDRGTRVFVEVATHVTLEDPFSLRISLEPHGEPAGRLRARGHRTTMRPDHVRVQSAGRAELRVPGLGDYRLRAVLLRDEGGYEDVVDVTPTSLSPITIHVADMEVRVDLDATVVDAALAKLRAVRR